MKDKTDAARIGKILRELRGIRIQKGVARELGISQNSLVNYEKGRRIPPDDVKKKIASYYGVSIDIFFCGS